MKKQEIRLDRVNLLTRKHMINQMFPKVKPQLGEEGDLYLQAAEDIEHFFEGLEKGEAINPTVIEKKLNALQKHFNQWQKVANGQSAFPEELQAMETILTQLQQEWKTEKGNLTAYYAATQKLDAAIKANAPEEKLAALYKEIELLIKK